MQENQFRKFGSWALLSHRRRYYYHHMLKTIMNSYHRLFYSVFTTLNPEGVNLFSYRVLFCLLVFNCVLICCLLFPNRYSFFISYTHRDVILPSPNWILLIFSTSTRRTWFTCIQCPWNIGYVESNSKLKKIKSIFLLVNFQEEDQFVITWIHVIRTI